MEQRKKDPQYVRELLHSEFVYGVRHGADKQTKNYGYYEQTVGHDNRYLHHVKGYLECSAQIFGRDDGTKGS